MAQKVIELFDKVFILTFGDAEQLSICQAAGDHSPAFDGVSVESSDFAGPPFHHFQNQNGITS